MPFARPIFFVHLFIVFLHTRRTSSSMGSLNMKDLLFNQRRSHSSLELVKEFFNRTLLPSCDLTSNFCDTDCCSDKDCDENELQSFKCSDEADQLTVDPIFSDPFYCYSNFSSYLTSVNPLLCYEIENSPYLGTHFLEEAVLSKKEMESLLEEIEPSMKYFTNQATSSGDHKPYKYGSPITYLEEKMPLVIPTSVLGTGLCSSQSIRYLLDVDNVCVSNASPTICETNPRLHLETYLHEWSSGNPWVADIDSGDLKNRANSVVSVYCGRDESELFGLSTLGDVFVECDDLLPIKKSRYNNDDQRCENVVTQLTYDMTWFENRLVLVNLTIIVSHVSLKKAESSVPSRKRQSPSIKQRFTVKFHKDHPYDIPRPASHKNSYKLYDRLTLL